MLSSITPLGERSRGNRWWMTVLAYLVGSVLGGAVTGLVLGLLGVPLRRAGLTGPTLAVVVAVLAAVALGFDALAPRVRLPRWKRQVNEDWMAIYRGWVYGFGWGFQLGLGWATIVTAALIYLVFVLALLSGSVAFGLLIGVTFGLARGLVILAAAGVDDPERLVAFHRSLQRRAPVARVLTVGADLLVLGAAVTVALR